MNNPFDSITHWSIDKPKTAVAVFIALILGLSMFIAGPIPESLGVGIEFDNSEDAFFPARESNQDVDLLYTIEETYTSSIDIVRMMVEFEPGALENDSTWMMLAELEAEMLEHSNSSAHRLDTGIGSVLGPASAAYGWSMMVEPENVYTSAMATAHFMGQQFPKGTAYVLGEGGLISSLHEHGFTLVQNDPDFVVVGEGINFTLEMVRKAIDFILDGAKLIATISGLKNRHGSEGGAQRSGC